MNVKFHVCGRFGHMDNQYRSKNNQGYNKAIKKNNVICYACNKIGHIAKYYRSKVPLVSNDKSNKKGKQKFEDIKQQHEKKWIRKSEEKPPNPNNVEAPLA